MHYLVTGGCGFIGFHLVRRLLADGHTLTVIDDLSNAKRDSVPSQVEVIVEDMTKPGVLDALVAKADGCFHLAAVVSVTKSTDEWLRTHQVTQGSTVALLDTLARKKRKIPVVFASSAATYGDCPDIPLSENSRCTPISAYGADKLACEFHARIGAEIHGIPVIGLRFFNVYGPGQDPASPYAGVISIFGSRMKQNQPVTVYGDGEQTRDYIYVGDIADGMVLAMHKLESKALHYGIFNLATGMKTSVNAIASMLASLTGTKSAITHAAARPGEVRVSVGDTVLSSKHLGFKATTPLRDGLQQTLQRI